MLKQSLTNEIHYQVFVDQCSALHCGQSPEDDVCIGSKVKAGKKDSAAKAAPKSSARSYATVESATSLKFKVEAAGMTKGAIAQLRKRPADEDPVPWLILDLNEDEAKLKMAGLQKVAEEQTVSLKDFFNNWRVSRDTLPVELMSPSSPESSQRWIWKIFCDQVS